MKIDRLVIHKLNGHNTYSIDISDNKFVLIGENGTGKSTLLAIMYYLLAKKWSKLSEYEFESIELYIDNECAIFSKLELMTSLDKNTRKGGGGRNSRTMIKLKEFVAEKLRNYSSELEMRPIPAVEMNKIIGEVRLGFKSEAGVHPPTHVIKEVISDLILYENEEIYLIDNVLVSNIETVKNFIENKINIPVLYLPTYRRIEQDIEQVFSHSIELSEYIEENRNYETELVNFGMKDVEGLVNLAMQELSSNFRIKLKDLIASSLQDILGHKYESERSEDSISDISEKELEEILARVDSETLSVQVKEEIRKNTKYHGKTKGESDKVTLYFINKLINLHKEQSKNEEHVIKFIELCNKYLVNKEIFFDRIKFEVYVILKGKQFDKTPKKIKWETLSSGEKQIISLFSKIFLGSKSKFIMIIDEPELSLSLEWQSQFLEDIINTEFCLGMFAVTHSPFIYANSLKKYAQAVGAIMEVK